MHQQCVYIDLGFLASSVHRQVLRNLEKLLFASFFLGDAEENKSKFDKGRPFSSADWGFQWLQQLNYTIIIKSLFLIGYDSDPGWRCGTLRKEPIAVYFKRNLNIWAEVHRVASEVRYVVHSSQHSGLCRLCCTVVLPFEEQRKAPLLDELLECCLLSCCQLISQVRFQKDNCKRFF